MKLRTQDHTGSLTNEVSPREREHRRLARIAAAEGMVLLKNSGNILPIPRGSKIALYGAGAEITVKGGTGSGDVNARDTVSVRQGLEQAGYQLTSSAWLDDFLEIYRRERLLWREKILEAWKDPKYNGNFFYAYSDHPFRIPCGSPLNLEAAAGDGADTAIFVLSRNAGEAADRREEPGDYYLTEEEDALLRQVSQAYRDVVLVLNTGGLVDLEFSETIPNLSAILYMVQGGQEGGRALADLICGDAVPSGKLTDSWAFRYADYPSAAYFGSRFQDAWRAEYREDIYVGYRYFDTFQVPVRYGFGFGLSYTQFSLEAGEIRQTSGVIFVDVAVKNIGARYAGKEVVQLYVSCPQDELPKEFRRLCCFGKTDVLKPGETQRMTLSFQAEAMASYDETRAAWILTAGVYGIWAGGSLESAALVGTVSVDQTIALRQCGHICPQRETIPLLRPDQERLMARQRAWQDRGGGLPSCQIQGADFVTEVVDYTQSAVDPEDTSWKIVSELRQEQLLAMSTGRIRDKTGELGSASWTVPGAAAETENILARSPWNVPSIVLADGPAGLRLKNHYRVVDGSIDVGTVQDSLENGFFSVGTKTEGVSYYQYCTAIPVGTLLAQSWNLTLVQQLGEMIGREMLEFEVSLWLAPGMNIHRNPLCGRNFEYYSEDPLVSGVVAAAMTRGVQAVSGCGTTIKHLACNNQEDKRKGSDSVLSERALREIYLKGFEIAVKTAQPMAIMTSYNMINGVHAANSYDLCTRAARNEWGFGGLIMTDWTTTTTSLAGECTAAGCLIAGNDLVMPGAPQDYESIRQALEDGTLSQEQFLRCVRNTVRISLLSNQLEDSRSYSQCYPDLPLYMNCEWEK